MLASLHIQGFALIDDLQLDFARGMNVLTGETGAGKSIIVDALTLIRGARARADMVRHGRDTATIDATFELEGEPAARVSAALAEHGIPADEAETLVIRRVLARSGRNRIFVQNVPSTRQTLATITEPLIDICSQHEYHSLTRASRHMEILDAFAGAQPPLDRYAEAYGELRRINEKLAQAQADDQDSYRRLDFLRHQIDELRTAAPEPGEYDRLRDQHVFLRRAADWAQFSARARDELYEADNAIVGRLAVLQAQAREGAAASPVLNELADQLMAAKVASEEAADLAASLSSQLELDPERLHEIAERIHELEDLQRKHRVHPDELHDRLQVMVRELDGVESAEDRLATLQSDAKQQLAHCRQMADELHALRIEASARLSEAITSELHELHLTAATMQVVVQRSQDLGPGGASQVELQFSANSGEPAAPIERVASGGELSRVTLAVKSVLSDDQGLATYVFDEVDAGVGGEVAEAIGRRLKRAATLHQVLCVTHLPQIAAFAARHFRVTKQTSSGRTTTSVAALNESHRIDELARMLGGRKGTRSARSHAQHLVTQARAANR